MGEEDGEEAIKLDQLASESEESKEESGMVTRGRANKVRQVAQSKKANMPAKRAKRKGGVK